MDAAQRPLGHIRGHLAVLISKMVAHILLLHGERDMMVIFHLGCSNEQSARSLGNGRRGVGVWTDREYENAPLHVATAVIRQRGADVGDVTFVASCQRLRRPRMGLALETRARGANSQARLISAHFRRSIGHFPVDAKKEKGCTNTKGVQMGCLLLASCKP